MGRPKDKRDRQIERAQAEIQRAISRQDGGGAAEHLLHLPRELRAEALPALVPLLSGEIRRAYAARELGRLSQWAARIESEPRLLSGVAAGAPDAAGCEALFMLILGGLRAREYPRTQRLLALLAPHLQARAPRLLDWLSAMVQHQGQPPAEVLATLPPLPPAAGAPDPRLGYDASAARPRPPQLRSAEQIPTAVAALFAQDVAPLRLKDTLMTWQRELPPAARPQLGIEAAPGLIHLALQQREVGRSVDLPLVTLVELNSTAPPALLPEVSLALRLATATALAASPKGASLVSWQPVAGMALRYPELREVVADLLLRVPVTEQTAKSLLPLLEQVLAQEATARLVVQALRAWDVVAIRRSATDPTERELIHKEAPPWLSQAASAVTKDGSLPLLLREEAQQARRVLQLIGQHLPTALVEQVLAAALPKLDAAGRAELGMLLDLLCRRLTPDMSEDEAIRKARALGRDPAKATFRDLLDAMAAAGEEGPPGLKLAAQMAPRRERLPRELQGYYAMLVLDDDQSQNPEASALLKRYGLQLLPDQLMLLAPLLAAAQGPNEERALLDAYLAAHPSIHGYLDLLGQLHCARCSAHFGPLLQRMIAAFRMDRAALAKGLQRAESDQMERVVVIALAQAVRTLAQSRLAPATPDFAAAVSRADRYLPRPRQTKAKAPAKTPAKRGRPRKEPAAPPPAEAAPAAKAPAKRGRPRKEPAAPPPAEAAPAAKAPARRGRPRKEPAAPPTAEAAPAATAPARRGRPRKGASEAEARAAMADLEALIMKLAAATRKSTAGRSARAPARANPKQSKLPGIE